MDIYFQDPSDIPLPPEEVRIKELRAEPYSDGRRVRILLEITPFQKRPNCEIQVMDQDENVVASLSIIESIDAKMDFTVHLKTGEPRGEFTVSSELYYYEDENAGPELEGELHQLPSQVNIVDRRKATFEIGSQSNSG
jgi:hypothetical protein